MLKKIVVALSVLLIVFVASPARAVVDTWQFRDLLSDDDVEDMRTALTELGHKGLASGDLPDLSPQVRSSAMLSLLLSNGMTVDRQALHTFTPLKSPAETAQCLTLLIEAGAEVASLDSEGVPLLCRWLNNSPEIVRLLIAAGADVNAEEKYDRATPLIHLSLLERSSPHKLEMIRLLLEAGANVEARNRDGSSSLLFCGGYPNSREPQWDLAILETLLDAGADPNARNECGDAPLFYWVHSPECTQALLDAGAQPDLRSMEGETALHYAVTASRGRAETVKMLLAAGAPIDPPDNEGRTPLMTAGRWKSSPSLLRLLLDSGAKLDARDEKGNTPLMHWSQASPECVALLLERGADPNASNNAGETPLYQAVIHDSPEIAELLADAGADLNVRIEGQTLMDLASRHGSEKAADFLKTRGVKRSFGSYLPEPEVIQKATLCLFIWGLAVAAAMWLAFQKPPQWLRAFGVALGIQLPFILLYLISGDAEALSWKNVPYILYIFLTALLYGREWPAVLLGGALVLWLYTVPFRSILRHPETQQKMTWRRAFLVAALSLLLLTLLCSVPLIGDRYSVQDLFGL